MLSVSKAVIEKKKRKAVIEKKKYFLNLLNSTFKDSSLYVLQLTVSHWPFLTLIHTEYLDL